MLAKIILVLIVIIFISVLLIKRFIYFRPSFEFSQPLDNYQDIRENGLHAWYKVNHTTRESNPTAQRVILFCHGNAGNITHRQEKLINLLQLGFSILIFDYPGFGQSSGVPSESACYSAADCFYTFLVRQGYRPDQIIPYGESLGAASAAYVARKYNLPIVILESGLPGIKYLVQRIFGSFGTALGIIFNEFDTVSYLNGYKGKLLVLHSPNDEVIPFDLTQLYQIESKPNSALIQISGTHNNTDIPWQEIKKFI